MSWDKVIEICKQNYKKCDDTCPLNTVCKRRDINTRERLNKWIKDLDEISDITVKEEYRKHMVQ